MFSMASLIFFSSLDVFFIFGSSCQGGRRAGVSDGRRRTKRGGGDMRIALGADSAGRPLLEVIAAHLARRPDMVVADLSQPGYYADVAARVGEAILAGR